MTVFTTDQSMTMVVISCVLCVVLWWLAEGLLFCFCLIFVFLCDSIWNSDHHVGEDEADCFAFLWFAEYVLSIYKSFIFFTAQSTQGVMSSAVSLPNHTFTGQA